MSHRNPHFWPLLTACALTALLGWAAFTLPAEPAAAVPEISDGIYAYAPRFSQYVDARVLAAGVAETVTVPAAKDALFLSCTGSGSIYVDAQGGTAAAPSGDVTDGSASELVFSGSTRRVVPGSTFSILNTSNSTCTLSYFTAIRRLS